MDDYISKSSVCEILADIYPTDGEKVVEVKEINKAYEKIIHLPSAPPERKKGCKIVKSTGHYGYCACDQCGKPVHPEDKFCSNCGADFREEDT